MSVASPPYHETINKLLYSILQYFQGNPLPMNVPAPPYYNVTNDLLYAILNSLNSGGQVIYTGFRVLYVSSRYGNDSSAQPNNINKPYLTITAAKNNSIYGDIIHVLEGTYDESNLFGNFTYWFDYGATVAYSGDGAIFQNYPGLCVVRGHGKFNCTGNGNVVNVGAYFFATLDMECESIEANGEAAMYWLNVPPGYPLYLPHRIKAKRIYSLSSYAIMFRSYSYGIFEADEIISDSTTESAVFVGGVHIGFIRNSIITSNNFSVVWFGGTGETLTIDNCQLISNATPGNGHGIHIDWEIDDLFLYRTRISCVGVGTNSIYSISALNTNLHIDNNCTVNADTGGTGTLTYVNKGNKLHLENNEATIDITGIASIDLNAFQNAEIIRIISGNPSETLIEIVSAPKHHAFKLLPSAGLVLTINSADALTAIESNIILRSPTLILNGDKGDWIELHNGLYGTGNREVNISNY
jgi:hypothetical protein